LLAAYEKQTRRLLQLPGSQSTGLYSDADIIDFINIARGQVAGEGECVRVMATIPTVAGQQVYRFQDAVFPSTPLLSGVQGIINIRSISSQVGTGSLWMTPRPWPWFSLYELNNAAPQQAIPTVWSQFGQGAASSGAANTTVNGGSFYLSPIPDDIYTLNLNAVCYPQPLALDTDVEALPYFWTDCVPFFAAYFALMSAQTNARMADAANMYKGHYEEFMDRARKQSNASTNRWQYDGAGDPAQGPKMGITPAAKGGG
jgi:hypothetical protein